MHGHLHGVCLGAEASRADQRACLSLFGTRGRGRVRSPKRATVCVRAGVAHGGVRDAGAGLVVLMFGRKCASVGVGVGAGVGHGGRKCASAGVGHGGVPLDMPLSWQRASTHSDTQYG